MWQTPKTDWTASDYYSPHIDLTRVEGNIHEIAASLPFAVPLDEKLVWSYTDFPTAANINRIVQNIQRLEAFVTVPSTLPPLHTYDDQAPWTADDANMLERHISALWRVVCGRRGLPINLGLEEF